MFFNIRWSARGNGQAGTPYYIHMRVTHAKKNKQQGEKKLLLAKDRKKIKKGKLNKKGREIRKRKE